MTMWPRLTPYAHCALLRARERASGGGRTEASPEHLLDALLENRDGMARRVLLRASIRPEPIRTALSLFVRGLPGGPEAAKDAVFAAEVHRIVVLAGEEARRMGDRRVGTEHLLMGVAREGSSKAAAALLGLGGTLERLRREAERLRPPGGGVTALSHAAGDSPQVSLPANGRPIEWWRRVVF